MGRSDRHLPVARFSRVPSDHGKEGPDLSRYLVSELNKLELAYIHIVHLAATTSAGSGIRPEFSIVRDERARTLGATWASGLADLESYGSMVLANPDFVESIASGAPLNATDHSVFFEVSEMRPEAGYTDFPSLAEEKTSESNTLAREKIPARSATTSYSTTARPKNWSTIQRLASNILSISVKMSPRFLRLATCSLRCGRIPIACCELSSKNTTSASISHSYACEISAGIGLWSEVMTSLIWARKSCPTQAGMTLTVAVTVWSDAG